MRWNELRKIVEKFGWRLHKHGANHDHYLHPSRPKSDVLLIGRHGSEEVPKGTYGKIKKQVGF